MSFLGNFAAAQSAKAIGAYNRDLYKAQSQYAKAKADINLKTYNQITRPLLVKKFKKNYSQFKVNALNTGAEMREGESTYLAALEFNINQATDLIIADYNAKMDKMDQDNQSILLAAKGTGEAFKGDLTARTETIKGFGSLLSTANSMGAFG
tara:strand:- start:173 stop:628 length:456 start_codon:yes stop_codon:yes gene_type:complete